MKLGVKEFRERFSEVAQGDESVIVTHHGRVVGRFMPEKRAKLSREEIAEWAAQMSEAQRRWRANTPDWRERLAALGMDEDGEPLET